MPFYESLCNAMTHARMHAGASGVLSMYVHAGSKDLQGAQIFL